MQVTTFSLADCKCCGHSGDLACMSPQRLRTQRPAAAARPHTLHTMRRVEMSATSLPALDMLWIANVLLCYARHHRAANQGSGHPADIVVSTLADGTAAASCALTGLGLLLIAGIVLPALLCYAFDSRQRQR